MYLHLLFKQGVNSWKLFISLDGIHLVNAKWKALLLLRTLRSEFNELRNTINLQYFAISTDLNKSE